MNLNLDHALKTLQAALAEEKTAGPINSLAQLAETKRRRKAIRQVWRQVQDVFAPIEEAMMHLSLLPPEEQIRWAQAVAAMPNVQFLEVDTTGLSMEDEIVRITLVNGNGAVTFDQIVKPTECALEARASQINGLTVADLQQAPRLPAVWESFKQALQGHYILSFGLNWDSERLSNAALRYDLEMLTIVGECLQTRAARYFDSYSYPRLAHLCELVGHPLPERPQSSIDRARGQRHVLLGMAAAITDRRPRQTEGAPVVSVDCREASLSFSDSSLDALNPDDDHPF